MKPSTDPNPRWSTTLRLGLAAGMLGIAAGLVVSVMRLSAGGDVLAFPGFSYPMLAPFGFGALSVGASIAAMLEGNDFKRPALVFGVGLLAIGTPYLVVLLAIALVLALIVAVVSG